MVVPRFTTRAISQILTKLYITIYTDKIYVGIVRCHFCKFVRELWPLIDIRITLQLNTQRHSGLLLHARHCSGAIVRFSDNSSFNSYLPALLYLPNTTSFMRASARELLVPFFTPLVWCGRDLNPRPPAPKADALPTELSGR